MHPDSRPGCTLALFWTHRRAEATRFLKRYEQIFTTRSDGKVWPRWKDIWMMAGKYNQALLSPGRKKSMQRIARRVNVSEDSVEQFIRESPWEHDRLQVHLNTGMPDVFRPDKCAFVVDEVGITKQGKHSVGVQRQYNGAQGKIGNSQVAVDLICVVPDREYNAKQLTWPLGMEIYLPKSWTEDSERREEAGIPDTVFFRTKTQIAISLKDRALVHGVRPAFLAADSGYGESGEFREFLRQRVLPYALQIGPDDIRVMDASVKTVPPGSGRRKETFPEHTPVLSAVDVADSMSEWETVAWTKGTKGKMSGQFARRMVRVIENSQMRYTTDEVCWLLLEKIRKDSGEELKAYLCWGMDSASLRQLVRCAHIRWTVEQFHRDTKQLLGLDSFEGRTWKGWQHHILMVLLAFAFIASLRAGMRDDVKLPSFPSIVRMIVLEVATQELMDKRRMPRKDARPAAELMLRGYSDW